MARLIGRIPGRQVLPGGARAQHPEDPVQDVAGIAPRPTAPIATQTRSWQERREDRPLGVGQVHAVEYDGHRNFVHSPRFGVYEIASSYPQLTAEALAAAFSYAAQVIKHDRTIDLPQPA